MSSVTSRHPWASISLMAPRTLGTAAVGRGVAAATSLSGGITLGTEHAYVNSHTARARPAVVTSVLVAAVAVTVLGCGRAGP